MPDTSNPINRKRLSNLLEQMIDIYSPTGKEGEITNFLEDYIKSSGLEVTRQEVEEDRENLVLASEEIQQPLLFTGHIDTIPAFDYDNYKFYETDSRIMGLGSADMKGGCAAMIEAFVAFRENVSGELPAALALVVGEEETGDGTLALLEDYHFPWALVGEPTDLVPCLSHFGYMEIQLNSTGRRLHASMANREDNAVNQMLNLLLQFTEYLESNKNGVVYNIRDVNSSQAGFSVPDWCIARIDIHLPPHYPTGELSMDLEEIIFHFTDGREKLEDIITFSTIHDGYQIPEKGYFSEIIKKVYTENGLPWQTESFRSDSDATLLWQAGIKPVILGPGKLENAHTEEECVDFNQVMKAAKIYYDILESLFNRSKEAR